MYNLEACLLTNGHQKLRLHLRRVGSFAVSLTLLHGFSLNSASWGQQPALDYKLSGAEVPRVQLVESFFMISDAMVGNDPIFNAAYLQEIGIPIGTNAEQIFLDAVEQAKNLREGEGTRVETKTVGDREETTVIGPYPSLGEGRAPELRARALARIYVDLENRLESQGVSIAGIERHILEQIAPGSSWVSDKPPSESPTTRAFDSEMEKAIHYATK